MKPNGAIEACGQCRHTSMFVLIDDLNMELESAPSWIVMLQFLSFQQTFTYTRQKLHVNWKVIINDKRAKTFHMLVLIC
jgi:hypothetical protein